MAVSEITEVVMDANTVTTIANNIDSLYSNAISQLTAYTFGIVAFVGVLIPAFITLIQWKSLKAEKEYLEARITDEITRAKSTIRDEVVAELKQLVASEENNLFSRLEEKFTTYENKLECAEAASFHIQGNNHLSKDLFAVAASDFCTATEGFLRGNDEQNGQRTLRLLIDSCLPKINQNLYEELELDKELDQLVEFLIEINHNNRYTDQIDRLNKMRKAAKNRVSKEKVEEK